MNDLISRRAAIDAVNEVTKWYWETYHERRPTKIAVIDKLFNLPSAQPDQQWIPCSERLPEEDKNVLVTVYFMGLKQTHSNGWNDHIKPSYYVDIASHIDGEWSSALDEYKVAISRHKVIAWMPMIEPYRKEVQGWTT